MSKHLVQFLIVHIRVKYCFVCRNLCFSRCVYEFMNSWAFVCVCVCVCRSVLCVCVSKSGLCVSRSGLCVDVCVCVCLCRSVLCVCVWSCVKVWRVCGSVRKCVCVGVCRGLCVGVCMCVCGDGGQCENFFLSRYCREHATPPLFRSSPITTRCEDSDYLSSRLAHHVS